MVGPDDARARAQYRRLARRYDRRTALAAPWRRRVVKLLELAGGETCLDVACGTGANFALVESRIGSSGRLIGLDLSPDMLALARARVERTGWENVALVEGSVKDVELPEPPDAILFSLTHDVLQLRGGLENLLDQARSGARIAVFGPKYAERLPRIVNPTVRAAARPYVTTFEGLERPWRHLEDLTRDLTVKPVLGGGAYLATATRA